MKSPILAGSLVKEPVGVGCGRLAKEVMAEEAMMEEARSEETTSEEAMMEEATDDCPAEIDAGTVCEGLLAEVKIVGRAELVELRVDDWLA